MLLDETWAFVVHHLINSYRKKQGKQERLKHKPLKLKIKTKKHLKIDFFGVSEKVAILKLWDV